jgi:hypothetical protein
MDERYGHVLIWPLSIAVDVASSVASQAATSLDVGGTQ